MLNAPKWTLKVAHIPSGIVVVRDSRYFRNQHLARESAIKYLKSKLAYTYKSLQQEDFNFSYVVPEDDNPYPRNLKEYREEIECHIDLVD